MKGKKQGDKNLTYTQRLLIESCVNAGLSKKEIAKKVGVCLTTIYNELHRGEYVHKTKHYTDYWGETHYKFVKRYSPNMAQEKYDINMTSKGLPLKIGNDYDFVNYVEKRIIQDKVSPCAIAGEIKKNNMFKTVVSKTTLYRYIELGIIGNVRLENLPFGKRKKRYRKTVYKRVSKGTSIEKRPLEIQNRNSFGHWEMDCVIGTKLRSDILLTLTERLTRYELVLKLPNRKASTIVHSLNRLEYRFGKKFRSIFKTITVDNGVEFSDFTGLEKSIFSGNRVKMFYCHPYTSCERGSNERLNREIRRWIPKGIDIKKFSDEEIQHVEDWINNYPRAIFDFETSSYRFNQELSKIG